MERHRFCALDALGLHPPDPRTTRRNWQGKASESPSDITYAKGGAVLRMLMNYMGEEKFKAGIQTYMQAHIDGNASTEDMWIGLESALGADSGIRDVANAWIKQEGFPLVDVKAGKDNTVQLSQKRFLANGKDGGDARWRDPMVIEFQDDEGVKTQRVLFSEKNAEVKLEATGKVKWVFANGDASGFYRANYEPGHDGVIQKWTTSAVSERVQLVSDLSTWPAPGSSACRLLLSFPRSAMRRTSSSWAKSPASWVPPSGCSRRRKGRVCGVRA